MYFKIDWARLMVGRKFTAFALFLFEGNFQVQAPRGFYIWRGYLMEGFLRYQFGGLIFAGAYPWRGLFLEFYGILSAHAIIIIIITIRAALAELNPWLIQFA